MHVHCSQQKKDTASHRCCCHSCFRTETVKNILFIQYSTKHTHTHTHTHLLSWMQTMELIRSVLKHAYRYLHFKVILVQFDPDICYGPLEEPGRPQHQDQLQVSRKRPLDNTAARQSHSKSPDHHPCVSRCYQTIKYHIMTSVCSELVNRRDRLKSKHITQPASWGTELTAEAHHWMLF